MTKTANFGLPLFESNENPAWLGDWNATMQIIDANMAGGSGPSEPATQVLFTANGRGLATEPILANELASPAENFDF